MTPQNIIGVVLAGGRSSRMGQPKCKVLLSGQPLLKWVVDTIEPQVSRLLINSNLYQHSVEVSGHRLAVVPDCEPDFPGPLTGLVSAFQYLDAEQSDAQLQVLTQADALVIVPCDGPFLPPDLVSTLAAALGREPNAEIACIRYKGKMQPTFSLWRRSTAAKAIESLKTQGSFKSLFSVCKTVFVDWPEAEPNPFFNINTPNDLALAESYREAIL